MGRDDQEFWAAERMRLRGSKEQASRMEDHSTGVDRNPQCSPAFLGPEDRSRLEGSEQECRQETASIRETRQERRWELLPWQTGMGRASGKSLGERRVPARSISTVVSMVRLWVTFPSWVF